MSGGTLLPAERQESRHLRGGRDVRIYLPPAYASATRRRFPVLYLHDGQNVFSSAGPDCCYGWGNWELDRTVDRLIATGRMRDIIMVAIDNSRSRYLEYRGRLRPAPAPRRRQEGMPAVDPNARYRAYASFITRELKPWVDRVFRTLKTPQHTAVMGSSMGGIASLALAWDHPKSFGMAASVSGAFDIERSNFLERVLQARARPMKPFRVYLDSGVMDDAGDDDGCAQTEAVAAELRRLGWKDGKHLLHFVERRAMNDQEMEAAGLRRDKWGEAQRSQHNECYWRLRAWRALEFLFPPGRKS